MEDIVIDNLPQLDGCHDNRTCQPSSHTCLQNTNSTRTFKYRSITISSQQHLNSRHCDVFNYSCSSQSPRLTRETLMSDFGDSKLVQYKDISDVSSDSSEFSSLCDDDLQDIAQVDGGVDRGRTNNNSNNNSNNSISGGYSRGSASSYQGRPHSNSGHQNYRPRQAPPPSPQQQYQQQPEIRFPDPSSLRGGRGGALNYPLSPRQQQQQHHQLNSSSQHLAARHHHFGTVAPVANTGSSIHQQYTNVPPLSPPSARSQSSRHNQIRGSSSSSSSSARPFAVADQRHNLHHQHRPQSAHFPPPPQPLSTSSTQQQQQRFGSIDTNHHHHNVPPHKYHTTTTQRKQHNSQQPQQQQHNPSSVSRHNVPYNNSNFNKNDSNQSTQSSPSPSSGGQRRSHYPTLAPEGSGNISVSNLSHHDYQQSQHQPKYIGQQDGSRKQPQHREARHERGGGGSSSRSRLHHRSMEAFPTIRDRSNNNNNSSSSNNNNNTSTTVNVVPVTHAAVSRNIPGIGQAVVVPAIMSSKAINNGSSSGSINNRSITNQNKGRGTGSYAADLPVSKTASKRSDILEEALSIADLTFMEDDAAIANNVVVQSSPLIENGESCIYGNINDPSYIEEPVSDIPFVAAYSTVECYNATPVQSTPQSSTAEGRPITPRPRSREEVPKKSRASSDT